MKITRDIGRKVLIALQPGRFRMQGKENLVHPRTLVLLLLIALAFSLGSCRTNRTIIKAPIKEQGPEYLITKMDENEFKFDWFSAKFNASYAKDRKKTDFSGQIRMRRDSVIWISISPAMGIEMVRLLITNDSVMFINRWEKTYFKGDYQVVNKFLHTNINFDILQSFILGNDFQFYENASFRAAQDGGLYRLSTTGRHKIKKEFEDNDSGPLMLVQNIWLDPSTFKILRVNVKEYIMDNRKFEAYYDAFENVHQQRMPTSLYVNVTSESLQEITIKYSRMSLNEPFNFPFAIPSKYERILDGSQ